MEKTHERTEPTRYSYVPTEGGTRREGHQDRMGYGRRKRADSDEFEPNGDPVRGRQSSMALNGESGSVGEYQGRSNDTFQTKEKHIKEGGIVGGALNIVLKSGQPYQMRILMILWIARIYWELRKAYQKLLLSKVNTWGQL
jgi:hypothetical protein